MVFLNPSRHAIMDSMAAIDLPRLRAGARLLCP
jgi:hypothetical protein